MLDWHKMNIKIAQLWDEQPSDNPHTVNGFAGTWNISDHDLIPECVRGFVMEHHPRKDKLEQIPLKDINQLLNDAWQGPGSVSRLIMLKEQARQAISEQDEHKFVVHDDTTMQDFACSHPDFRNKLNENQ